MNKNVKCVISGIDSNGESNFHFLIAQIAEEKLTDEDMYNETKEKIEEYVSNTYGYERCVCFFEEDENSKCINFNDFEYNTSDIVPF